MGYALFRDFYPALTIVTDSSGSLKMMSLDPELGGNDRFSSTPGSLFSRDIGNVGIGRRVLE